MLTVLRTDLPQLSQVKKRGDRPSVSVLRAQLGALFSQCISTQLSWEKGSTVG